MPSGVYTRTEEHRAICRKARAASSGSKGKHWSETSRKAQSERLKGKRTNTGRTHFQKGHKAWNIGEKNPWTEEHIASIKKANTGRTPWNKGLLGGMPTPWNKVGEGITPKERLERLKFRKSVQSKVFERDNYTCQICDQYSGYLQVDHIKGWAKYPELRFDLDNCRTLCMACHYYVTFKRKMPEGIVWGHNLKQRIT